MFLFRSIARGVTRGLSTPWDSEGCKLRLQAGHGIPLRDQQLNYVFSLRLQSPGPEGATRRW